MLDLAWTRSVVSVLVALVLGVAGCAAGTSEAADGSAEGAADAALFDTAPPQYDTGPSLDTGNPLDAGHGADAPQGDTGANDGKGDSSPGDAAPPMESGPDTSPTDSTTSDTGPFDSGAPETGSDSGAPDAGVPDSGSPDGGSPESGTDSSSSCATSGFSGTLATFDLVGEPGDEASAAVTSTGGGATSGSLSRAATISPVSGVDSINGSGWGTGTSADSTRYYTFSVTPGPGCTLKLASLAYDVRASGTGPSTADVATSADAFTKHTASFAGTSIGTATLKASGSGAIEIRIYGYAATGSGGTFRIRNTMTLSGSVL